MIDLSLLTDEEISDLRAIFDLGINLGIISQQPQNQKKLIEGKIPIARHRLFKFAIDMINGKRTMEDWEDDDKKN